MQKYSPEFNAVYQNDCSSSSEIMINNGRIIDQNAFEEIFEILRDDAILDLCLEIHRAAKIGYLFLDTPEKSITQLYKYQRYQKHNGKAVQCYTCEKLVGDQNVTKHLQKCLENQKTGRKIVNYAEYDGSDLDDESPKERSSKRNKNTNKPSKQGKSLSEQCQFTFSYLKGIPYEDKRAFFDQFCGAECKRNKRLCRNTPKCSQHTSEERSDIRNGLLRDMSDQIAQNSAIDVDTVDEDVS